MAAELVWSLSKHDYVTKPITGIMWTIRLVDGPFDGTVTYVTAEERPREFMMMDQEFSQIELTYHVYRQVKETEDYRYCVMVSGEQSLLRNWPLT